MSTPEIPEHAVTYGTREGEDTAVVELVRAYPGDIADVWDALTNPQRLPRWFLPVTGELRLGGRYQLEGNAGGTITDCDAPRSFSSTWEFGGFTSWITVSLDADGDDRTTVRLAHTVATDNDHWRQFGPGAVGIGWDLGCYGLGLHLASGASVDPEAAQAWSLSPEGIGYVSSCGESWYLADKAGGADDGEARLRADACVTFYTVVPPEAAEAGSGEQPHA